MQYYITKEKRMPSKGKQLKDLINAPKILIAPGVYDGYSVRLLEKLGFKSGSTSSRSTFIDQSTEAS